MTITGCQARPLPVCFHCGMVFTAVGDAEQEVALFTRHLSALIEYAHAEGSRLAALARWCPICANSVAESTFRLSEPQHFLPGIVVAEKKLGHRGLYPHPMMVSPIHWLGSGHIWDRQHLTDINQLDLLAQLGVREKAWRPTSGDTDDRPGSSIERCCHARPKHVVRSFSDDATSVQNSDALDEAAEIRSLTRPRPNRKRTARCPTSAKKKGRKNTAVFN